jgi:tetratricopeptide (TPR) repeat protein
MFDDGTPPNHEIRIEKVCGGEARFEAYTDSKGRFTFNLDNNQSAGVDSDVSDEGIGLPGIGGRQNTNLPPGVSPTAGRGNPYWNCELRASYPGYRSEVVELANRRAMDDPDVGTIVLHRLANVRGSTISLTSALAPKRAEKEYQKGMQAIQKDDFEQAERHLQAATTDYPKYAEAWFALGQVNQKENKLEEAQKCFHSAIDADPKFVSPYSSLASIAAGQSKWEDAAKYSAQVIDLNPVEFPGAFWVNALANYNLRNMDQAGKSATALIKLDTAHHYPMAEMMLAQLSLNKGNLDEAASHLRTYLALDPNAKNAEALKQQLLKMEQAKATPHQQ